jgi:hypothetical protein
MIGFKKLSLVVSMMYDGLFIIFFICSFARLLIGVTHVYVAARCHAYVCTWLLTCH